MSGSRPGGRCDRGPWLPVADSAPMLTLLRAGLPPAPAPPPAPDAACAAAMAAAACAAAGGKEKGPAPVVAVPAAGGWGNDDATSATLPPARVDTGSCDGDPSWSAVPGPSGDAGSLAYWPAAPGTPGVGAAPQPTNASIPWDMDLIQAFIGSGGWLGYPLPMPCRGPDPPLGSRWGAPPPSPPAAPSPATGLVTSLPLGVLRVPPAVESATGLPGPDPDPACTWGLVDPAVPDPAPDAPDADAEPLPVELPMADISTPLSLALNPACLSRRVGVLLLLAGLLSPLLPVALLPFVAAGGGAVRVVEAADGPDALDRLLAELPGCLTRRGPLLLGEGTLDLGARFLATTVAAAAAAAAAAPAGAPPAPLTGLATLLAPLVSSTGAGTLSAPGLLAEAKGVAPALPDTVSVSSPAPP
jgi:hypothetical protein